jgi:hypothetical protein
VRADGKNLSLVFGTVEVNCVSTSIVLDNDKAEADRVTFADVIAGLDRQWFFTVNGYPDYSSGTFWSWLWEQPAFTPFPYVFKPYGNAAASAAQPHFTGSVTIDQKPPLGGDAGNAWTFGTRLTCTAQPVRVTT